MRLASLAKPITAVAIMRLVETGRLALGQRVFGAGALLGTRYGTKPYTAALQSITLRHLLEHTAGGWPNDATDPMFTNPTMNHAQLITWVLDNRPLQFAPGTRHMYSTPRRRTVTWPRSRRRTVRAAGTRSATRAPR